MTEQRRVFVVGGARGIGKKTADLLLARGDQLFVADLDELALAECEREWDAGTTLLRMDITDRHVVRKTLQQIAALGGALDAVIVTAGIHSTHPVEHLSDAIVDRVLNVNLVSHIKFVRDVIPLVRPGGRLVAVSSLSAEIGIPMQSLYSASKAGLELFYESLNGELRYKDIRCVLIQPGNVNTGFNETGNDYQPTSNSAIDEMYRKVVARIDSRYGIAPEQVAKVIADGITRRNPPLCFVVGGNARKANWAKRLLGRDLAQKILARAMGL